MRWPHKESDQFSGCRWAEVLGHLGETVTEPWMTAFYRRSVNNLEIRHALAWWTWQDASSSPRCLGQQPATGRHFGPDIPPLSGEAILKLLLEATIKVFRSQFQPLLDGDLADPTDEDIAQAEHACFNEAERILGLTDNMCRKALTEWYSRKPNGLFASKRATKLKPSHAALQKEVSARSTGEKTGCCTRERGCYEERSWRHYWASHCSDIYRCYWNWLFQENHPSCDEEGVESTAEQQLYARSSDPSKLVYGRIMVEAKINIIRKYRSWCCPLIIGWTRRSRQIVVISQMTSHWLISSQTYSLVTSRLWTRKHICDNV